MTKNEHNLIVVEMLINALDASLRIHVDEAALHQKNNDRDKLQEVIDVRMVEYKQIFPELPVGSGFIVNLCDNGCCVMLSGTSAFKEWADAAAQGVEAEANKLKTNTAPSLGIINKSLH